MSSKLRLFVLSSAFLAIATAAAASPSSGGAKAFGRTYGEWSAKWWQWLFSVPASESPFLGQGEVDCQINQHGPVVFLAGAPSGTTAVRSCTVPAGKPLFFPVLNGVYRNEPPENLTVAEKRDVLEKFFSDTHPGFPADFGFPGVRACKVTATLDGAPVNLKTPIVRVQSPPFLVDSGDDPVFPPANLIEPEAISEGFWVLLGPLSVGEHTLHFSGSFCELDNSNDHPLFAPVSVTYTLTVGP